MCLRDYRLILCTVCIYRGLNANVILLFLLISLVIYRVIYCSPICLWEYSKRVTMLVCMFYKISLPIRHCWGIVRWSEYENSHLDFIHSPFQTYVHPTVNAQMMELVVRIIPPIPKIIRKVDRPNPVDGVQLSHPSNY